MRTTRPPFFPQETRATAPVPFQALCACSFPVVRGVVGCLHKRHSPLSGREQTVGLDIGVDVYAASFGCRGCHDGACSQSWRCAHCFDAALGPLRLG